jgi:hypothetical protein
MLKLLGGIPCENDTIPMKTSGGLEFTVSGVSENNVSFIVGIMKVKKDF